MLQLAAMKPTIALLTDFGLRDSYVGVMKAVMRRICPEADFIDITHAVPPQDVRAAALTLMTVCAYFPSDTVFLAVVDPGVGTERRPLAVYAGDYYFVAPDNGLLSYVLAGLSAHEMVELRNPAYQLYPVSHTFHGRDVFAPAAAHLAVGVDLKQLGPNVENMRQIPLPRLAIGNGVVHGEVLYVDHFGNIVTSIGALIWLDDKRVRLQPHFGETTPLTDDLDAGRLTVTYKHTRLMGLKQTYGTVAQGEMLALTGSSGFLELAVNQGDCAAQLEVKIGDAVEMRLV